MTACPWGLRYPFWLFLLTPIGKFRPWRGCVYHLGGKSPFVRVLRMAAWYKTWWGVIKVNWTISSTVETLCVQSLQPCSNSQGGGLVQWVLRDTAGWDLRFTRRVRSMSWSHPILAKGGDVFNGRQEADDALKPSLAWHGMEMNCKLCKWIPKDGLEQK